MRGVVTSPFVHSISQQLRRYFAVAQQIPIIWWRRLCIGVLAIWLCQTLAQLFWLIMPLPDLPEPVATALYVQTKTMNTASAVDIEALKALNLFGSPTIEQEAAIAPVVDEIENSAVDTTLNLILKGIISSTDPQQANAIIAQGQKQALYGVGDELPAGRGVKLARVLDNRVILDNQGRYESLWLYQEDHGKISSLRNNAARQGQPSIARQRQAVTSLVEGPRGTGGLAQTQPSLADVMKVSIVREEGQVVGYRIRPGNDRDMFNRLGLRANDVVTSVNGVTLDSSSKAMEVYKTMKGRSTAQLELKRDGEVISVDVDLGAGESQ